MIERVILNAEDFIRARMNFFLYVQLTLYCNEKHREETELVCLRPKTNVFTKKAVKVYIKIITERNAEMCEPRWVTGFHTS